MKICRADFKITTNHGWLSPDGKFYKCTSQGHIDLAFELGFKEDWRIEEFGWVKISCGEALWSKELTQNQLNLLFDWYGERGIAIPSWMKYQISNGDT